MRRQIETLTISLALVETQGQEDDDRNSKSSGFENPFHGRVPWRDVFAQGRDSGLIGRVDRWVDLSIKFELPEYSGGLQAEGFID